MPPQTKKKKKFPPLAACGASTRTQSLSRFPSVHTASCVPWSTWPSCKHNSQYNLDFAAECYYTDSLFLLIYWIVTNNCWQKVMYLSHILDPIFFFFLFLNNSCYKCGYFPPCALSTIFILKITENAPKYRFVFCVFIPSSEQLNHGLQNSSAALFVSYSCP